MKKTILFTIYSCISITFYSCNKDSDSTLCSIQEGYFRSTLTETGELVAVNSIGVNMPFIGWKYGWRYKIIDLVDHGDHIKQGDTVASIDPSPVLKVLEEEQNKLEIEKANLNKLIATHKNQLSQLKSELNSEKANYDLIELQVEQYKFEPIQKRKIKSLELEIAEIKYQRIQRKLELQKVVINNELNIQKTKISQIKNSIRSAEEALSKLNLITPIDGIIQLERNWSTDKMVQVGDETGQGWPLISVPDMSAMKVSSTINEQDIYKILPGQQVSIRLDAFPENEFGGKIITISKLSREKEEGALLKVFDFEILVSDSDPSLKPGMTVSCEIVISELKNTMYVDNNCIMNENSEYFICLKDETKIPVNVLGRNNSFTAIKGNVKKGQKILRASSINLNN